MEKIASPGKLLLTSEYVVLDGALALAVPSQWGQSMEVAETEGAPSAIFWEARHQGERWLSAEIDFSKWEVKSANMLKAAEFICHTLKTLQGIKPSFQSGKAYHFKTNLEFLANYGLGSSSTLMANLAKWSGADAFLLNEKALGGSGYDIAVAMEQHALLYQIGQEKRKIKHVDFTPDFKDELIFVHLNQKQDSREGIKLYKSKNKNSRFIERFSELTNAVLEAPSLSDFSELMQSHEALLSEFLGLETVKEKYFRDCPVFMKSLGAWGGDFILSAKFSGYKDYFSEKGFEHLFEYKDIIL
ncbi:GYDIA family GHMP kinase [Riemerella columbipharyngis]|uniref:Mevalonate kinase n=1 Tax=Riemerella columbipharyngis TaxID=1071918 RepID=A0A1G7DZT4_9FLAO|nr:GYDIA family GHMP kinase [Riemerella columbipharyngis]SDE56911.1 Mevalonate kinase [Riemerella columbipharyngis]